MECESNEVRDSASEWRGVEVRVYVAGDFHYSRVHPIPEASGSGSPNVALSALRATCSCLRPRFLPC